MSETLQDRVSDAPADIWVYRLLPRWLWPYAQLARWDRPIGWWLLLWPCWWSLALAIGSTSPEPLQVSNVGHWASQYLPLFISFWLGAVVMRGAGCTYNDIVDVKIDERVTRTASRPIPSGRVSKKQAVAFTVFQALIGLGCLIFMSTWVSQDTIPFAVPLGLASLLVVMIYPFAKRVTNWPQLVLGLAFSWGALMGWAVIDQQVSLSALLMYIGSICWVIGYDTIYAHQDREDDALVGVRSTARLFGDKTKPALIMLYSGTLSLFVIAFFTAQASWPAYLGLVIGSGHMIWQIRTLNIDDPDNCLALFKSNTTFGWIVFAGLVVEIFI